MHKHTHMGTTRPKNKETDFQPQMQNVAKGFWKVECFKLAGNFCEKLQKRVVVGFFKSAFSPQGSGNKGSQSRDENSLKCLDVA